MTPFEDLISQLGAKLGVALHVDPHQSCKLEFADGSIVQIDLDNTAERVVIGSMLGNLMTGPFRENVLKQALIVNGIQKGKYGILAYSEKNDQLILFSYLPLAATTGDSIFDFLKKFINHGAIWREALKRGDVPPIEEEE